MSLYTEIIEKLLEEVDTDIKEIMLKESDIMRYDSVHNYKGFELLQDPANTILQWQALRDRKKKL